MSSHKQPQVQCWGQAGCVPRPVPPQRGGCCMSGTHLAAHRGGWAEGGVISKQLPYTRPDQRGWQLQVQLLAAP